MILPAMPGPRLVETSGQRRAFAVGVGEQIVGRGEGANIVVEHPDVSRRHARLVSSDEGVLIEDLGSKNGVFVNGTRIETPTLASHGDRVGLGDAAFELIHPASRVRRALAARGEATVTRTQSPSDPAPSPPGLVLPIIGVVVFAGLVAVMLWF